MRMGRASVHHCEIFMAKSDRPARDGHERQTEARRPQVNSSAGMPWTPIRSEDAFRGRARGPVTNEPVQGPEIREGRAKPPF